jgi:predicted ribosome quality control (RQC) complex YloA/Tae2 family protein
MAHHIPPFNKFNIKVLESEIKRFQREINQLEKSIPDFKKAEAYRITSNVLYGNDPSAKGRAEYESSLNMGSAVMEKDLARYRNLLLRAQRALANRTSTMQNGSIGGRRKKSMKTRNTRRRRTHRRRN